MLAAVFKGNGKLDLVNRSKPKIKKGNEVLIKVTAVGICGTDLHILQVPPAHPAKEGIILGHEFTGKIVEVGTEVQEYQVGEHVIVDPHPGCGVCPQCKNGKPDRCERLYSPEYPGQPQTIGIFSDGAMTNYLVVPDYALYKISPAVPAYIAALAEPLACVVNATEKVRMQPGETAVVIGAGPIGLLFSAMLKAAGAKVIVSELTEYRRKVAKDIGVDLVVNPKVDDLEELVMDITSDGSDVVVEAVGSLLNDCIKLTKPGGKIIQFGHDELALPKIEVAELVRKELTIYGGYIGKFCFGKVARIMENGNLPLQHLVSHRLPLSKVKEGVELLRKGEGIKVVLEP